ncbi:hypothetical protein REPUB_Repub05bG0206800 [Reevesia pubescens]
MASNGESSSATLQSTVDKPVVVRVKRKVSRLDAFGLEINERPLKRPFLDFLKLSISESSQKEELKSRKVFVQHVDTVISSEATVNILQSFMPNSADATDDNAKSQEGRLPNKTNHVISIFLSSFLLKQHNHGCFLDPELIKTYLLFIEISLADQKLLSSYLPLLKELIPTAAAEIESDMRAYMFEKDEYVYDYYTVKDDMDLDEDTALNPFLLWMMRISMMCHESEYDSEDSNAEDNPRNDYPDEISEEYEDEDEDEDEEVESKASDQSEEGSNQSSEVGNVRCNGSEEDGDLLYEDEIHDAFYGDANHLSDDDGEGEDWRWSYSSCDNVGISPTEVLFFFDETGMDLIIRLPASYPLRPVDVDRFRSLGISEVKQRKWLMSMMLFVRNQNGALAEAIRIWKRNFDKEFEGVEECPKMEK